MKTNDNYYRALNIIDRIEEIREEKGIGKTIVGKTLGYSRQYYYSAYDNCRCLKVKTLDRIAKILDVSLEYLLTGKNKKPYRKIDINFDLIKNTKIKKLPNYLQSTRSYLRSGRCTDLNTKSLFEFEEYSKIPAIKLIGGKMLFKKEVKIHEKIFPQATPEDQLMHLCEELNEMDEAEDNFLDEWADALFVAISLQRFEHTKRLAELVMGELYLSFSSDTQELIYKHLKKAIKKVKSRKYYFINGKYEREKNV